MITLLLILIGVLILIIIWLVRLYANMKKQKDQWIKMYLKERIKGEKYGY